MSAQLWEEEIDDTKQCIYSLYLGWNASLEPTSSGAWRSWRSLKITSANNISLPAKCVPVRKELWFQEQQPCITYCNIVNIFVIWQLQSSTTFNSKLCAVTFHLWYFDLSICRWYHRLSRCFFNSSGLWSEALFFGGRGLLINQSKIVQYFFIKAQSESSRINSTHLLICFLLSSLFVFVLSFILFKTALSTRCFYQHNSGKWINCICPII